MRAANDADGDGPPPTEPGRRSTYKVLAVASRALLLEQVRGHPNGVDTATLARLTGLHPNTVRFHLDVLARAGLVSSARDPARKAGRPRLVFVPARVPPPVPPGTSAAPETGEDGYGLLAAVLVEHLSSDVASGAAAEEAGRSWVADGRVGEIPAGPDPRDNARAVAAVTGLLADLGFAPETVRDRDGWRIFLHRCPFHALAAAHPDIVCRLHLGLLQGAVDRLGRIGEKVSLHPFIAPGLCEAVLPVVALGPRPAG
ncbi:MAG: helix-turn-helix domain-containing protein [Frankiaceae bacterium]